VPLDLRFVLLRPRVSENLGAAARALKNFGFSDWGTLQSEVEDLSGAERLAVQAADVLAARMEWATLDEALADRVWIVGTSSRKVPGKRRLSPREVAEEALRRGPTALVFGDERSGLTNDELERCHALSALPTDAAQPSVNLAQALLLYAYEARNAALSEGPGLTGPRAAAATDRELRVLEAALGGMLQRGGFLKDDGRQALPTLLRTLVRTELSRAEASLWTAALKTVEKHLP
jgi:TrmH family RNA methyltransferase